MKITQETDGPWHLGFARSFCLNGSTVTVVAGDPEVVNALAEYFDAYPLPHRPAIVGTPVPLERKRREVIGS